MPQLAPLLLALLAFGDKPPQAPAAPIDLVTALESALADSIARAEPSVVAIAREKKEPRGEETGAVRGRNPSPLRSPDFGGGFGPARGGFEDFEPAADYIALDYGSGVVIGDKGEILTTFGVVKGASYLLVRAMGNVEFEAEVIAADPRSDLAVIVPREDPRRRRGPTLRPIAIGDASTLRKGNFLLALGNPFNAGRDGQPSASWGILSNLARRLDSAHLRLEPNKRQLRHYPTLLQLDAKLNLGMSGGAVVNLKGELVGLTTNAANAGGFDAAAGYALPMDAMARRAIDALKLGKEVEYGFLGIRLDEFGTNRIASADPGTPAGEGGLVAGDEILSIGGYAVTDADSLVLAVNRFSPGTPIPVKIRREAQTIDRTVTLSKLGIQGEVIATNRPDGWRGLRVDFVGTNPGAARGNDVLGALAKGGVIVSEVQAGSAADDAGLKVAQVIVAVGGERVRNPAEFAKAVATRKGPVVLTTEGNRDVTVK